MTDSVARWWRSGTPPSLKLVYLVLAANGIPAFVILMSAPGDTADLFVWTVQPEASARLLGVMYGNALLLILIGLLQPDYARARITLVLIAFFSVAATVVTLVHLDPFLEHPWFHLTYWLSMYLILFVAAPTVLVREERAAGRLEVQQPLSSVARIVAALSAATLGTGGVALFVDPDLVSDLWPWTLTPLVGRIFAVWLSALAVAYLWALRDGDFVRARPIFLQGPPTGALLALVPLLHRDDLKAEPGGELLVYLALAALLGVGGAVALATQRGAR